MISRSLSQEMEPPESLSLFDHTHLELEGPGAFPAGGSTSLSGEGICQLGSKDAKPICICPAGCNSCLATFTEMG